jgi:hypothetical protein
VFGFLLVCVIDIVQLVFVFLVAVIVKVRAFVVLKVNDCSDKSSTPSNKLVTKFEVEELK